MHLQYEISLVINISHLHEFVALQVVIGNRQLPLTVNVRSVYQNELPY